MSSDRSRLASRPDDGFVGIAAQQGRVILDRDVNALQDILLRRLSAETLDIVGPCGTPDDGFRIEIPDASPPQPFYSPPEASPPEASQPFGEGTDFLISSGVMYLGGQRVEFPALENGRPVTYSYLDQPDWPSPDLEFRGVGEELVYLDALLQEISAVEDPDLLEVALGGPDTTQRLRFLTRVKRARTAATDCASAWSQMVDKWHSQGLVFDPADMSLRPKARLQVGFAEDAGGGDPCDPVATGGYLGADNQLIRVRLANDDQGPAVVWGYDNASFLYRITAINPDGVTITLAGGPPDTFHCPTGGQVVEILATATVLGSDPDATDPTGAAQILRVAAESTGVLNSLAQPYGPITQGDPTSYIVLSDPIDPDLAASPLPLFLRVWQARLPYAEGAPITLEDPSTGVSTGVTVTFSGAKTPVDGAFWEIAVRPATPQGVYPEGLLERPHPPVGPVRYVCPLAVINWRAQPVAITDCREVFDNLVELTRRKPGCCTVSIGPRDLVGAVTLQSLIDRAATKARAVTICLAAGTYVLTGSLILDRRHNRLTIESCGGPAMLKADTSVDPARFGAGMIVIHGARGVTLSGLGLEPVLTPIAREMLESLVLTLRAKAQRDEAMKLWRVPAIGIGIRAFNAPDLTLDRCFIDFLEHRRETIADLVAAAVLLQGECPGFKAKGCVFTSAIAPTFTPLLATDPHQREVIPDERAKAAKPGKDTKPADEAEPATDAAPDKAAPAKAAPAVNRIIGDTLDGDTEVADAALTYRALPTLFAARGEAKAIDLERPVVATVGILAMGFRARAAYRNEKAEEVWGKATEVDLGAGEITGNTFRDLTFGAVIHANFTILKLNDNTVSGGVGGFWAGLPSTRFPMADRFSKIEKLDYIEATMFEESLLLAGIGPYIPPPIGFFEMRQERQTNAKTKVVDEAELRFARAINATLFVSGNSISTGQHPPPRTESKRFDPRILMGSCALLLWMDDLTDGYEPADSDISTLVTGNHLINASRVAPTAMVLLANSQACTITGNIILNPLAPPPVFYMRDADVPHPPLSLLVAVRDFEEAVQPVAISGNVLRGLSNLAWFARDGAADRRGWSPLNADPN